jgi:hypothetical protein
MMTNLTVSPLRRSRKVTPTYPNRDSRPPQKPHLSADYLFVEVCASDSAGDAQTIRFCKSKLMHARWSGQQRLMELV